MPNTQERQVKTARPYSLDELVDQSAGAVLTACIVFKKGADPVFMNAFSVLDFKREVSEPRFEFLTPGNYPVRLGGASSDYGLIVGRSELLKAEAEELLDFEEFFVDPRAPKPAPVLCAGTWVGPYFLGNEETRIRDCLPSHSGSAWIREKRSTALGLSELTERQLGDLKAQINDILGVDLSGQSDRLGAFIARWREVRVKTRWKVSRDCIGSTGT